MKANFTKALLHEGYDLKIPQDRLYRCFRTLSDITAPQYSIYGVESYDRYFIIHIQTHENYLKYLVSIVNT